MGTHRVIHHQGGKYRARFHSIWYWVLGLWTFEAVFWTAVGLVWLATVLLVLVRTHRSNRRTL